MDEGNGRAKRAKGADELILRTIAAHAESLLRTARKHSLCVDDAHDAYQRALEIFVSRADRLDPGRAAAWLHVVVKHEAQAIRATRQKLVGSEDVDLDEHEAPAVATPEERALRFDMVRRSAEALQRLKPQEMRALWLKAQGHSYNEICALTGWSYTKVNRCLSEGRRSFLERYGDIESGEECARWMPLISAMADGEIMPERLIELRPHLRNCPHCRATLKTLRDSSAHLSAVLPVPLAALGANDGEQISSFLLRVYEAIASGMHERALNSYTKAHAVVEAAAAGKVAAVAASTAAVAGSGYATVLERVAERPRAADRPARTVRHEGARHEGARRLVRAVVSTATAPSAATPKATADASAAPSPPPAPSAAGDADAPAVTTAPPPPPSPAAEFEVAAEASSPSAARAAGTAATTAVAARSPAAAQPTAASSETSEFAP